MVQISDRPALTSESEHAVLSTRTLCLAILNFGEATGYEIRKSLVDGNFSYFGDASFGSIYPTLAQLERDGAVSSRHERRAGKPKRRIYTIEEKGRMEFVATLMQKPAADVFRSPFLLVAMCAGLAGEGVIHDAIDSRLAEKHKKLVQLRALARDCVHSGTKFIAEYGLHCINADITFLEQNRDRLMSLARESGDKTAIKQGMAEKKSA